MDGVEKAKPPDPGGTVNNKNMLDYDDDDGSMQIDVVPNDRKRRNSLEEERQTKKRIDTSVNASASIAHIYKHPMTELSRNYSSDDKGPFIVHVAREDATNAGLSLRPIKVGLILVKNKVQNVVRDGVKSLGRNRVSIEFKSASDANKFLSSSFLTGHKLVATIPSYNVHRMGLVRGVPIDWSMEEFVDATDRKEGPGKILKARRLQRKVRNEDGSPSWVPTQSVVLTFEGQRLPEKIFAFYTSLTVQVYQLPTIQCHKCLRYGHVEHQCRSDARCYRCAKKHPGKDCKVAPQCATCLYCLGRHYAIDKCCPEYSRQKAIKLVMSEDSVSYNEAAARFPVSRRSYADTAKQLVSPKSQLFSEQEQDSEPSAPPFSPLTQCPDRSSPNNKIFYRTISSRVKVKLRSLAKYVSNKEM
ncbi:hypothetical protein NE865_14089 [Phthorimaea operculella]|nr:hypothetical protein NE865_14089 [Phthorimaea operculella]